jgi:asparaginyl-tRNA synthetase
MFDGVDFQSEKIKAVLKVKAKVLDVARCWLNQHDYVEVHGPMIVPAVGDWPGYFDVKYFGNRAYLSQGLQPYAKAFVANFGKVYTIAPAFRAEKAITKRHLTEYWRIEIAQKCDLKTIIEIQEELVAYICQSLSKKAIEELKYLRNIEYLSKVKAPFYKLTYDEAIETLQRDGLRVSWGQKIDWELENHLSRKFDQPFFITEFPVSSETFFFKTQPNRSELTLTADLLAPEGYGEISGGGQMIDGKGVLVRKMKEEKVGQDDQKWYMTFMQYHSAPQSGFAIGLERLIQWICKLKSINEASLFPRHSDSIYP